MKTTDRTTYEISAIESGMVPALYMFNIGEITKINVDKRTTFSCFISKKKPPQLQLMFTIHD